MTIHKLRWLFVLAIVPALLLVAAACGDDDDDDDGGDTTPAATETADASTEEPAGEATPNDDGDDATGDDGDDAPNVSASGSDREYAAQVCTAFREFFQDFSTLLEDPDAIDSEDPNAFAQLFADPLQNLRDRIADIDPPGDYEEFNGQIVAAYDEILDGLRAGNADVLEQIEIPEPDPELQARLEAAAEEVEECQEAEAEIGGGLFGNGG